MKQVSVQLRVPSKMMDEIDGWVKEGRFASRSDAIRGILALYEERERTGEFLKMLCKRREEALKNPDILVPL